MNITLPILERIKAFSPSKSVVLRQLARLPGYHIHHIRSSWPKTTSPHVETKSKHHWHDIVYAMWKKASPCDPNTFRAPLDTSIMVSTCAVGRLGGVQGVRQRYGLGIASNSGAAWFLCRELNLSLAHTYWDNWLVCILIINDDFLVDG
jgi:hypothetical protein